MNNYTWLLDAGHGGLTADGRYTTAPAKMHVFEDGLTFYEGVNNRAIVDKLIPMLEEAAVDYERIYDPVLDTPLSERVEAANKAYALDKRCVYLSIHSDAMPDGAHGKGSGFAVYTSKGQTASDALSEIFCETYASELKQFKLRKDLTDGDADRPAFAEAASAGKEELKKFRFRKDLSDGDLDFEEDFYVLRKTNCPAILIENLFFDNREEAEFLLSESGRQQIANALFQSILYADYSQAI